MPEYLSPGVYVEEIVAGPRPIAPVATSTAGAVGVARRGPTTPTLVTSYGDFVRTFGGPLPLPDDGTITAWADRGYYWQAAEGVKAFFDEGGARLYFQRVVPSAAVASNAAFNGGLYARLVQDVDPADTTVSLSHVFAVVAGTTLAFVTGDGTAIGTVTAASVDYPNRIVTLTAAAGLSARRGRDLAAILPVDTTLAVLSAEASSRGAWGDDLSVQVMPVVGARRPLGATPTSGNRVSTPTAVVANAGATSVEVMPVPGSLDTGTAVPFAVRINSGPPMQVTAVAAAAANLALTLGTPLAAAVPAGSEVVVLRPAAVGAVVTVVGADRVYPGAIVQLETATGAEVLTVVGVAGAQVTLSAAPANPALEGDTLALVEAEVDVRYRPAGGTEQTERFSGLRLADEPDPSSLIAGVNLRSRFIRLTAGAAYDPLALQAFPAVTTGAWAPLGNGDDALGSLRAGDFIGDNLGPGQRTGIQALEEIDEVAICIVPSMWDEDVRTALILHCETLADRFAIIDPPPGLGIQQVQAFRSPIDTDVRRPLLPLGRDPRPTPGGTPSRRSPPSGFVAGVYARADVARGVHKAPANELLRSIRRIVQNVTKREQDVLNPQNINVLRAFPNRGNRVWGARVLTSDAAWQLRQRPPALPVDRGVDRRGHAVGGLRAQRRAAVGPRAADGHALPAQPVAHRRAAGRHRRRGVLRRLRPLDDEPGRHRQRAAHLPHRHRPGQARGVRDLPDPAEDPRDRDRLSQRSARRCLPSDPRRPVRRPTTSGSSSPASATTARPSAARSPRSAASRSRSTRSSTATATRTSPSARSRG